MTDSGNLPELADSSEPGKNISLLTLGALGVVFGDIGTSPLYAFKAAFGETLFKGTEQVARADEISHVMGALSLFVWSIIIVICLKYILLMMRADNDGEGGVLAMFSLLLSKRSEESGLKQTFSGIASKGPLALLAIIGAALLYGDGVITPAISVLAASEGINFAAGGSIPQWVSPATAVVVLAILFSLQKFGSGQIGRLFGPVMLLWFLVIGALGLGGIIGNPAVLEAINPMWAIDLFLTSPWMAFVLLGAVVLCVTGCEALSLDMGHFGRPAIRIAWFSVVCPALLLNYFGQAAYVMGEGKPPMNPFYSLVPDMLMIPMIILSIIAAIIASQAIIAGVFSVTRQAIRLLLLPPTSVRHTSKMQEGQIYIPMVNWLMFIFSVLLVLAFQNSDRMGAAYGLAVTGVMLTSTIMLSLVARRAWGWSWFIIIPLLSGFLLIDLAFLGANLLKVPHGGWVPLVIGLFMIFVMTTWLRGSRLAFETRTEDSLPLADFIESAIKDEQSRIPGCGVFFTAEEAVTPNSLMKFNRHMPVLPAEVVVVHVHLSSRPRVPKSERVVVEEKGHGFWQLNCSLGYMQDLYLPRILRQATNQGLPVKLAQVTYYLRRDLPSRVHGHHMSTWRKEFFFAMLRNAKGPTDQLSLPSDQVMEIGVRLNF